MKLNLDFSKVESGGGIKEGKYIAVVEEITKGEGKEYPYLKWNLKILNGGAKGLHINHFTTLKPSGLFNLRNTLEACGLKVPKSAVSLDINKLVGKKLGIEVIMRETDGKEYPNVKKTFKAEEFKEVSEVSDDDVPFDVTEPEGEAEDELELEIPS